jgi:hypothetical protein
MNCYAKIYQLQWLHVMKSNVCCIYAICYVYLVYSIPAHLFVHKSCTLVCELLAIPVTVYEFFIMFTVEKYEDMDYSCLGLFK